MATDNCLAEMPFFSLTNYELVEQLLFKMESVRKDLFQNSSFYNNVVSKCNNEFLKPVEFSYSTDCEFNNLVHKSASVGNVEFCIFHLNMISLNKNHRGLIHLLQELNLDFDVLVLTEVWSYNLEFFYKYSQELFFLLHGS